MIELCAKRHKKGWDNLLIIDGDERSGKSTLGRAICHYYSTLIKKPFGNDNVFFDPEEVVEYAIQNRDGIILWDESCLGGMAQNWQNVIQQKLNTMLMISGKYHHFYLFIIPSFYRLNRYLAIERSIGLIHVYSPDLISRGLFTCLNKSQKTWVYNNNKKSESYGKSLSFRGRFCVKNTEKILDEKVYDSKKDYAIKKYLSGKGDKTTEKLEQLQYRVAVKLPIQQAVDIGNVSQKTIYNWRDKGEVLGYKL